MNGVVAEMDARPPVEADAGAPGRLAVELRHDLTLGVEDRAALESLIDDRPHAGVFTSRAWLTGFFDGEIGLDPALLLMREAGRIRAVFPIAVRRRLTHVHIAAIGGAAGSDRIDLLAAAGYEAAAADAFVAWLSDTYRRNGLVLALRDVPAESALWGALHRAAAGPGPALTVQPREVHTLPYLDLTDAKTRSAAAQSATLVKHRRWLERRGRLRIERLETPRDVLNAFEWLQRFLHARWRDYPGGSALDDSGAVGFHRRVLPLLLEEGRLRMIRLLSDTRTVAVFYGLASGRWWGYYLAGYDREWAGRIHLGRITLAVAIEAAAAEGATEFDFLKGAEPVKYLWPVRTRATVDADVYSEHAGAQLVRASRAAREALAALAKSGRRML